MVLWLAHWTSDLMVAVVGGLVFAVVLFPHRQETLLHVVSLRIQEYKWVAAT